MTNVLLFESDRQFAQTLADGLLAYGCETTVVEDGEEGISAATQKIPDLILLTIELPRMNGFSVCNKLKRNNDLKQVPLVLLSSEATQETFEQHKRLRTRADEYVHKPVTLEALVEKLKVVVPLKKAQEVEEIEEVVEEEIEEARPESLLMEAEEAFGNLFSPEAPLPAAEDVEMDDLVLEDDDGLAVAPEEPAPVAVASATPTEVSASADVSEYVAQISALQDRVEELQGELQSARDAAAAEADAKVQVAQKKDAEIELVQREVEELQARLQSKEAGGSAREFLDLREQLNKKDKEILDVRDQLTSKEKELVRLNDENISLGRTRADLEDQVTSLESTRAELQKQTASLKEDKAQAAKRADDFKAKSERLQAELDVKVGENRALIESHENMMATRDAQEAAMRDDHATALREAARVAEQVQQQAIEAAIARTEETAAAEKEQALVAAAAESNKAKEAAVLAREAEMKAEQDSKLAALHRANEESLRKLRAEHEAQSEADAQAAAQRLTAREQELEAEKQAALSSQRNESEQAYEQLLGQKMQAEQERDSRIAQLEASLAERTTERDTHATTIGEYEQTIERQEAALAAHRADAVQMKDEFEATTALLTRAREKWSQDSDALQSAEAALSMALEAIGQAQKREMP